MAALSPDVIADLVLATGELVASELTALGPDAAFHPAPGEWCAQEVAGHLIEAERRGFAGRIRQFLADPGARAVAWDQDAVERERGDCRRDTASLADELRALRRESVALIRGVTPAQLEAWGTHPKVGRITVGDLLHEWVHHDRNHTRQLLAVTQERVYPEMGNCRLFVGE